MLLFLALSSNVLYPPTTQGYRFHKGIQGTLNQILGPEYFFFEKSGISTTFASPSVAKKVLEALLLRFYDNAVRRRFFSLTQGTPRKYKTFSGAVTV